MRRVIMSKYKSNIIYQGSLVKFSNNRETIFKNTLLLYDKDTDTFYKYDDVFNYLLDLDLNPSLSSVEREKYQAILNANRYPYGSNMINKAYILEDSIQIASFYEKKGRGK